MAFLQGSQSEPSNGELLQASSGKTGANNDGIVDSEKRTHPQSAAGLDLDSLTLYEKKCVLINREVDEMGMGKYQWWIWALCGEFRAVSIFTLV